MAMESVIPVASARGFRGMSPGFRPGLFVVRGCVPFDKKPPAEAGGMTRSITHDASAGGGVQSTTLHLKVAAEWHSAESNGKRSLPRSFSRASGGRA